VNITYNWRFWNIRTKYSAEDKTDIVVGTNCTIIAVDDDTGNQTEFSWKCELPPPISEKIVLPYTKLTPDILQDWVISKIGPAQVDFYQEGLARDLAAMSDGPVVVSKPPWEK